MYVKVMVTPSAKKEKVEEKNGEFFISVKEPAQRNLANKRVRELVASHFGVSLPSVRMLGGHRSTNKLFSVDIE